MSNPIASQIRIVPVDLIRPGSNQARRHFDPAALEELARSIGEVLTSAGARWELQLKGAGTTPFCRNADGRAVLRSSVREYLASEAMFHMGVPTTRALSLVASATLFTRRAWCAAARNSSPPGRRNFF